MKNDTAGREDGFGLDFAPTPSASELRCDICDVEENSLAQMEIHYNGKRHKKKLNSLGLDLIENKTTPSSSTKGTKKIFLSLLIVIKNIFRSNICRREHHFVCDGQTTSNKRLIRISYTVWTILL